MKYIIQQVTCRIFVLYSQALPESIRTVKTKIRNIFHSNLIIIHQKIPIVCVLGWCRNVLIEIIYILIPTAYITYAYPSTCMYTYYLFYWCLLWNLLTITSMKILHNKYAFVHRVLFKFVIVHLFLLVFSGYNF